MSGTLGYSWSSCSRSGSSVKLGNWGIGGEEGAGGSGESGGGGAVAFLRVRGLGLGAESVSLRLLTLCRGWSLIMVGARLTLSNWEMESQDE